MLNIIERFVQNNGWAYGRLDGSTPVGTRQARANERQMMLLFEAQVCILRRPTRLLLCCGGNVLNMTLLNARSLSMYPLLICLGRVISSGPKRNDTDEFMFQRAH